MSYLRAFKDLCILDLYGTDITREGVLQLDGLHRIRELDLSGFRCATYYRHPFKPPLSGDGLLELGRRGSLPDLERFSTMMMEMDNVAGLANFPALRSLSLRVKKARDLETLRSLKQLRTLGLTFSGDPASPTYRADCVDWPDSAWANMDTLENLDSLVFFNGFGVRSALRHIGRLKFLKYLALDLQGASGYDLALLAPLRNLQHLELTFGTLNAGNLALLAPLRDLNHLRLSADELNAEDLAKLPEFGKLESLCLSANEIREGGLTALPKLESLKTLNLNGTLTTAELGSLRKFPRLQELDLVGVSSGLGGIPLYDPDLDFLQGVKGSSRSGPWHRGCHGGRDRRPANARFPACKR